jgi:ankyrin repeat protein
LSRGTDSALAFAVRSCHEPVVEELVKAGVKIEAKINGAPMIVLAAESNCAPAIEMLLSRGADVDEPNEDGNTALMSAASHGFAPLVQLLLDRGADMERTNKSNESAWLIAAMSNEREIVESLRAHREAKGGKAPR